MGILYISHNIWVNSICQRTEKGKNQLGEPRFKSIKSGFLKLETNQLDRDRFWVKYRGPVV